MQTKGEKGSFGDGNGKRKRQHATLVARATTRPALQMAPINVTLISRASVRMNNAEPLMRFSEALEFVKKRAAGAMTSLLNSKEGQVGPGPGTWGSPKGHEAMKFSPCVKSVGNA